MTYYNADTIRRLIEKYTGYVDEAEEYGEPGYTRNFPSLPIYFANWNKVPKKVLNWLEERIDFHFEDEWITAEGAGHVYKAYRTQPDCYSWKPSYLRNDWTNGEVIGFDVFESDPDLCKQYIEEYLLNDPTVCDALDLPLEDYGFKQFDEEFEIGFYHQNDDPAKIMERYQEEYSDYDFVFGGLTTEQFRSNWNIYGRKRV